MSLPPTRAASLPVAPRETSALPPASGRASATAREFVSATIAMLPIAILLRFYEVIVARMSHPLPSGAVGFIARGLRSDLAAVLWSAALLALPVIAIGLWRPRVARVVHRTLLVILVAVAVLLAQYFAVTLVPLGSDLFGYSLAAIRETAGASRGVGVMTFVPIVVFAVLSLFLFRSFDRLAFSRSIVVAAFVTIGVATAFPKLLTVSRGAYPNDVGYYLAENKSIYFASRTRQYLAGRSADQSPGPALTGYPLVRAASNEDVLGPFLTTGTKLPNLVFVVVEGLGRDFVGPGATYGGFTPFLDSLTTQSLYWENFLSSSGRTFGVLPGLLASAPYGKTGFADLGPGMPPHQSLVSLLKERGYHTEFFTGTQGHFDNIDVFLNREGIDRFVDQSGFGPGYTKQPAGEAGGESWGYPDQELIRRSFEVIGAPNDRPRLDVYLTITTHEPFIPPREPEYDARFRQRIAALPLERGRKAELEANAGVFRSLLYLDDAVRMLIEGYRKRSDFARTIFFITGDHRLIPLPETGRLDRFHVPFIVYSPMVRAPRKFSSVSSHLDVTPSILAMLAHGYAMDFPKQVAWLGSGIDTAAAFRSVHSMPFMRTKNTIEDYLAGEELLSGDEAFRVEPGLRLSRLAGSGERDALKAKLASFRAVNAFVTSGDHLYPGGTVASGDPKAEAAEDSAFHALAPADTAPERAFLVARQKAFAGDYRTARLLARRVLRVSPNNNDARTLLARTYAWDHQYDTARVILRDVLRRAGGYADASAALIDVEIWSGHPKAALAAADSALAIEPRQPDLLFGRAKALEQLKRGREAVASLDALAAVKPDYEGAANLRRRLTAKP